MRSGRLNRLQLLGRAFELARITPRASRPTARVLQSLILDSDCGFFNCERGTFAALRAYVCGMVTFRMSPLRLWCVRPRISEQ
jgi:hypothetical protein